MHPNLIDALTCPNSIVASKLNQKILKWGTTLNPWGDVQYLKGFFDWLSQIYATLNGKGTFMNLVLIVKDAHYDDQCLNDLYRVFCDL